MKVEGQNLADWGILMCTFQKTIYQPMSTALKTANFILEQCFISGRITKLREAGQVQACSGSNSMD